jgi:hypothetical protein
MVTLDLIGRDPLKFKFSYEKEMDFYNIWDKLHSEASFDKCMKVITDFGDHVIPVMQIRNVFLS